MTVGGASEALWFYFTFFATIANQIPQSHVVASPEGP